LTRGVARRLMPDMRSTFAVVLGLVLAACQGKPASEGAPSAGAAASAPAGNVAPKPTAEPLPKPEKLDVAALRAALKCSGKPVAGPCEVLEDFKECGAMNPVTQSGEGRWLGKGYLVKNGAFVEEFTLLRSHGAPASQVGAGTLPARMAIDSIPDERSGERTNAEKAINAFERGDVPLPTNTAIRYVVRGSRHGRGRQPALHRDRERGLPLLAHEAARPPHPSLLDSNARRRRRLRRAVAGELVGR